MMRGRGQRTGTGTGRISLSDCRCIADFMWTYTVIKLPPEQPQQPPQTQQHTTTQHTSLTTGFSVAGAGVYLPAPELAVQEAGSG